VGGAFATAALYLILLALGAGFGLSFASPWSGGVSASAIGAAAIAWLILSEVFSSALGGYLTGRLRTKWARVHTDEVYFRDTANGFLAWSVALVLSVTFLASAGAGMAGRIAQSGSTGSANIADPSSYFIDALFRSDHLGTRIADPAQGADTVRAEAGRIFDNALRQNQMSTSDQNYLAGMISAVTGITQFEAEGRISNVMAQARQAEDTTRKVTARVLLWFFLALLIGAFSASYAATIGGRQRDHVLAV
jgi:hypothetical protein